jgi:hypothetical protein
MKTENDHRKELIRRQLTLIPNDEIGMAIQSWQPFAMQLMDIVGEDGFLVMFARSLHLLRSTFPMLPNDSIQVTGGTWLAELKNALSGQDLIQANSANHQLLMTFTNILASLIGEDLTVEILHSAWGDNAANKDPVSKENDDDK